MKKLLADCTMESLPSFCAESFVMQFGKMNKEMNKQQED
jgi:hypothetical protein